MTDSQPDAGAMRELEALRENLFAMTAWKNRLAEGFERAEQRVSELLAWKAEASARLATLASEQPAAKEVKS